MKWLLGSKFSSWVNHLERPLLPTCWQSLLLVRVSLRKSCSKASSSSQDSLQSNSSYLRGLKAGCQRRSTPITSGRLSRECHGSRWGPWSCTGQMTTWCQCQWHTSYRRHCLLVICSCCLARDTTNYGSISSTTPRLNFFFTRSSSSLWYDL